MTTEIVKSAPALLTLRPGADMSEERRKLVHIPAVMQGLNNIEQSVLKAATSEKIALIDEAAAVDDMRRTLYAIAVDVGYSIPDKTLWQYTQTRIWSFVKKYYSHFSISDIRLAFELLAAGELDYYLPRDSNGNADKKHYGQFSVEYFGRILKAYTQMRRAVVGKAYELVPEEQPKQQIDYSRERKKINRMIFLRYKYTGELDTRILDEKFLFEWMYSVGLADAPKVTDAEKSQAYAKFMRNVVAGLVNEFTAGNIKKEGKDSKELEFAAYDFARRKEIKKAFDSMIAEEIQIDNLI